MEKNVDEVSELWSEFVVLNAETKDNEKMSCWSE